MKIRDRIKELRRVPASSLVPNPRNWRTHPRAQRDALQGILAEVGYADVLLARESETGELLLIDGHLRAETTPDQEVPVLVLDLDAAEADKLLAVLDPLAVLAEPDRQRLEDLLGEIETENSALQQLLVDLAGHSESEPAEVVPAADGEPAAASLQSKFAIIVHCESEERQLALLERFAREGLECRAFVV
jgi:hypothetical protein